MIGGKEERKLRLDQLVCLSGKGCRRFKSKFIDLFERKIENIGALALKCG